MKTPRFIPPTDFQPFATTHKNIGRHGLHGDGPGAGMAVRASGGNSDFINNYFIKGPISANNNWINNCTGTDRWYATGNYYDLDANGTLNGTAIPDSAFTSAGVTLLTAQQHFPASPVPVDSASAALSQAVSGKWGCQPIDAFDSTLLGYVKSYGKSARKGP